MPIKFKCNCGQVLSVPSKMAGKTGNCPKCKKSIKIPIPKGQAEATAKTKAKVPASATSDGKFDSLLDEAGLKEQKGPTCPECRKAIRPGTVICTACGYNFETGERMAGFDAKMHAPEFDNLYLQEASENMVRDQLMDTRRDKAQMPWWVIMSFLIGAMTLCAAGVIIVDGKLGTPADENTFLGKIQRWPVFTTIGMTSMITGIAITSFAHLSITVFGFTKSIQQGFLCFFLPLLYSIVYGIMNWVDCKSAIKAIGTAMVFIGFGIFLIVQGGGFDVIANAFR